MIKASDLFKRASKEEIAKRRSVYPAIRLKEKLDEVKKTKLSDGTWHIHGTLDVSGCCLTTLKNLNVSIVDGSFYCHYNKLTSLYYAPAKVNENFYCWGNKLTALRGVPTIIYGSFYCWNNKKKFTKDEVRSICNVKGIIII